MNAEIITIGDEILIGQVVDTNSAYISESLNNIGVSVYQITSIQDDKEHILKALQEAENNADIVILTGGLGPTKDDITKKTIAEYFNDTLVQDESVLNNIKRIWNTEIKRPLLQVNIDQALVPSKSEVLMNSNGSAPGMWLEKDATVFISLPGVPLEMKALIKERVLPKLQENYKLPFIFHKTLLVYGVGESRLAARIEEWEDNLPDFIKLAYLPSLGKMRLRLSAKGQDKESVISEVDKQIEVVLPLISDEFIGFEEENNSIEVVIGGKLTEKGLTVATAESFTGGTIAKRFTANPGSSLYFKGSIVSYATETKINVLGVPEALINKHSVVSTQVVEAMASKVLKLLNTDFAIATTGNAGPTKGDSNEEVGTVFIAIASKDKVFSEKFNYGNHREKVVDRAVNKAFELLIKEI